jgi:hypothetical protein
LGTTETAASDIDTLAVQVRDTGGNVLTTLKTHTNQQVDHLLWARESFDLSAYKGQTVQLYLGWNCPTTKQSFWRVDDLALIITNHVLTAPVVTAFAPSAAAPGASVVLTGTGFTGSTSVAFNGVNQPNFAINSDTQITTTVPGAATTGLISVTNPLGTGASSADFTVLPAPVITLAISPRPAAMLVGTSQTFIATVSGADPNVLWSLTGGGQRITSSQLSTSSSTPKLYTAPATVGTGSVTITAQATASASATDSVTFALKSLDFNGNGVDVLCMSTLAMAYGSNSGSPNWNAACDLNGDGLVDDADVTLFLNHF